MSQEIDTPATGSPTRVHYICGPNNEAMPVDPHGHDIFGLTPPTIDPGDVLKRLDDLTRRVDKLEHKLAGLAILMSKISPRRIEKLEEEMRSLKLVSGQSTTGGENR